MRTILRFMLAMLVPLSIGFSASAQTSGGTTEEPTSDPLWGTPIEKTDFVTKAGIGEGKSKTISGQTVQGFATGDFFIMLIDQGFFPEYHGSWPGNADHTSTKIDNSRLTDLLGTKQSTDPSTTESNYLFYHSINQVYKLNGIPAIAHKRTHRQKADIQSHEYNKPAGKLYAYNGDLSRFFFVESNKDYAFTGGGGSGTTASKYYNPYKFMSSGNHMVPNDGSGDFCEYGVDPQDLASVEKANLPRAITRDWLTVSGSQQATPLETTLTQMTKWDDYGCFAFTHDCSGGTMRSHFMHTVMPQIVSGHDLTEPTNYDISPGTDEFANFQASIQKTTNKTILIFLPNKPTNKPKNKSQASDWIQNNDGDFRIYPTYAPYIQYYRSNFCTPDYAEPYNDQSKDVWIISDNSNFVRHQFAWYTNVYDKYNRNEGTTENPGDKKGIETFDVYARVYLSGDDFVKINTNPIEVRPFSNDHQPDDKFSYGTVDGKELERKSYTYYMEYQVVSTITELGVSTTTVESLVLPVPALEGSKSLNLTVFPISNAVDKTDRTAGDSGQPFGYNHITHKLTITPSGITKTAGDTYTVTREYDNTPGETFDNSETITIVWNGTECVVTTPQGATYGATASYDDRGNIILTLTEIRVEDYVNDRSNCDRYKVEYTAGATSGVIGSGWKVADYYTTNFVVVTGAYEQVGTNYRYSDSSQFDKQTFGQTKYIVRAGDKAQGSAWIEEASHNVKYDDDPIVSVPSEREIATPPPAILYHVGYLYFENGHGTWGVGWGKAEHTGSSKVRAAQIPHNQILDVTMGTGGSHSHPIWKYPEGKESTKQIFPGVDFDIYATRSYDYKVAFGLVIYEKVNGTWVRKTEHGEEYFNKIQTTTASLEARDEYTLVWKPTFKTGAYGDLITPDKDLISTTQNVMYDFTNSKCKYDAFTFYVNGSTGEVVAYSHSGDDAIKAWKAGHDGSPWKDPQTEEIPYYDSQEYIDNLPTVVGEQVQFVNTQGVVVEGEINKLKDEDLKAYTLYHGNKDVENDGFAYFVLDLKNAIPERDANFGKEGSRSENLIDAVTSYKITATQENNESDGKPRLKVFRPTLDGKEGGGYIFDYAAYKDGQRSPIQGTSWQNAALTDSLQVYYEYIPVTTEGVTKQTYSLVEGVNPTSAPSTTVKMDVAGNTHTLIGLRNIDLQTDVWPYPNTDDPGSKGALRKNVRPNPGENYLKNAITFLVEPEFTIACPELPLFSFGREYPSTTPTPLPTYVNDEKLAGTSTPKNQVHVTGNKNPIQDARKILDYFAHMTYDHPELDRVLSPYVVTTSIVSGAETINSDDVKVFADGRDIVVEGAEGEVIVFNAYGQSVYAGHSSRIAMAQPGVYLVAANGSIYKVFVK